MQGFELTERDMISVHSAQFVTDILISCGLFGKKSQSKSQRDTISRMCSDCNDIANEQGPFKDRRLYDETKLLVYKF